AYPWRMCSCLQCDATLRCPRKCLLHRIRCRRQFLFQNDFACFIQNTVERPTISQIHTDRQLLLFENFVPKCLHSANLFHSRSPFHCAKSASFIGSVSHPVETGLLIPSDNVQTVNVDLRLSDLPSADSRSLGLRPSL